MSLWLGILVFLMPGTAKPGIAQDRSEGRETIALARATWDTGWFQTEVVKKLLEELGYAVDNPRFVVTNIEGDGQQTIWPAWSYLGKFDGAIVRLWTAGIGGIIWGSPRSDCRSC